jgi:hypothetical protein
MLFVFQDKTERDEKIARRDHDWSNQKKLFGNETEKAEQLAKEIYEASLASFPDDAEIEKLLKKLYGISKAHHVTIKWLGQKGHGLRYPDQFIVSKKNKELGIIQF